MKLKNVKKMICSFVLFLLIVIFSFNTFATTSTGTTTLELVDESVCTINIKDMVKFEKKITDFDKEKRSASLSLTLTNLKNVEQTEKPVEIFLVLDNSTSMTQNITNNTTRKQAVINSATTLVNKLFEANKNVKVGVVSFSSLDSVKGETEGTINDATLALSLNNSKTEVQSAIDEVASSSTGPRTNIEAGITIASDNFSSDEDIARYIVLLTDGVPNNATDGSFATYAGTVGSRTKAKLLEIEESGTSIIGAMIGLASIEIEPQTNKSYQTLAEEVFGTVDNPTISSYYYIQDSEIETTIVEKIYANIVSTVDNSIKNITIKDYFPQEIIDNFNFEYNASPNIGNVSQEIDKEDNSITWTIEILKEGEVATLNYNLTLKDNYNKEIVDKILPTNKKVDITAEHEEEKLEKTSDVSPKVKVLYKEPVEEDKTIAPTVIPQTGNNSSIIIILAGIISVISIIRLFYLKSN